MKEWFIHNAEYFLSDWQNLLVGGVVVMSVVIFLMGVLKKIAFNRIKHDLLRKIVLAWSSVLVALPVTAVSVVCNGFSWSYFWAIYILNAVGTILVYWFYENTALRDALALLGKKTVMKFIGAGVSNQEFSKINNEVNQDAQSLIAEATKSASKYKDDDLKKL